MNGRVLIVDDDDLVREVIQAMLTAHDFASTGVGTSAELRRAFRIY